MSFNLDHFDLSDEMEENWSQYPSEEANRSTTTWAAVSEGDPVLGGNYNHNHNSSVEMSSTNTSSADLELTSDYIPGTPIQFPPEMTNWDWDSLWSDNVPDECDPSLLSSPGDDMVKEKKMDIDNNDIGDGDQTNVAVACYEDNCSYEPSSFISSPFDASTSSYDNGDEDNVSLCESSIEFQFQTPASPLPTPLPTPNRQYQQNNPRLGFHYGSLNSHQLSLATTTNAGFNLNPEILMIENASIPHISESSASTPTANILLQSNDNAFNSRKRKKSETMSRAEAESVYTTTTTTVQSQLRFTDLYTEINGKQKQVKVEPVEIEDASQNETSQPTLSLAAVHVKEKKAKRPKKYESADRNDPSVKNAIAAKANRDKKKHEEIVRSAENRDLKAKLAESEKNLKQARKELAIEKNKNKSSTSTTSTSASNQSQQTCINSKVNALIQPIQNQFGHMNVHLLNRNLQVNTTNTTPNDSLLTIHIYPVEQKLIFDYDPSFNFF